MGIGHWLFGVDQFRGHCDRNGFVFADYNHRNLEQILPAWRQGDPGLG